MLEQHINNDIEFVYDPTSGTNTVLKSRRATEQNNLKQDDLVYNIIASWSDKSSNIISYTGKKWSFKEHTGYTKSGKLKYKEHNRITRILNTIVSRLEKNIEFNREEFGFDQIDITAIQLFAKDYLKTPNSQRVQLCTQSSRQGVDEKAQIEFNQRGIIDPSSEVIKPNEGQYTIDNDTIVERKNVKDKKTKARSVDCIIRTNNAAYYGFLKYSGPEGSVTGELQSRETVLYVDGAIGYCKKNDDNKKFFLQIDGATGERLVQEYKKMIPSELSDRIFAGTSQEVVQWINSK